jgi:putative PIN family toxin of toxin-antitoxin system
MPAGSAADADKHVRVVLDPNVIVSAVLSRDSSPAKVLRGWIEGAYELVVSPTLLDELARVFRYPKIAARVTKEESEELLDLFRRYAQVLDDPTTTLTVTSQDPDDDYLIALAAASKSIIVSGDSDLLGLAEQIPVCNPAEFLRRLQG